MKTPKKTRSEPTNPLTELHKFADMLELKTGNKLFCGPEIANALYQIHAGKSASKVAAELGIS